MLSKLPVQLIQHDAGLDRHTLGRGIQCNNIIEVSAVVDHQRLANRLAALRCSRPAG